MRRKPEKFSSSKLTWNFSEGTTVYAESFDEAVNLMKATVGMSNFWASEILEGMWDVQLGQHVIVHNVAAETVTEAVKRARWVLHLDSSFKKVASYH